MMWNRKKHGGDSLKARSHEIRVIKARAGWQAIDFQELKEYWGLLFSFVWRDIKVMYAQTILGLSWAIIQPLVQIVLFTIVFGKVARISTDGIPYPVFLTAAIIPWNYIAHSMSQSSESLITGQHMLGKIYFPRLIFPMAPILSKLVNFGISLSLLLVIMIYYRVFPTVNLMLLPLFLIMMVLIPASGGLWLSSLAIRFRDVRHAMPFFIQLLMYTGPVVYPVSALPEKYRIVYSLNPIVGVIEGFRASLLGLPVPWVYILPGMITGILLFVGGAFYFRRMERIIVDVI
jgi:lipopolysaccharide transport system permease protein